MCRTSWAQGDVQGKRERNMIGVNESELERHTSADGPFVWRQFSPREFYDFLGWNIVHELKYEVMKCVLNQCPWPASHKKRGAVYVLVFDDTKPLYVLACLFWLFIYTSSVWIHILSENNIDLRAITTAETETCDDFITQKPTALPSACQLLRTSKWQKVMLRWRLPLRYWDRLPALCLSSKTPLSSPVTSLMRFISAAGSRSWSPVRFNHCLHMVFPAALGNQENVDVRQIATRTERWLVDLGGLCQGRNWGCLKPKTPLMLKIRLLQTISRHLMLSVVQSELLSLNVLIITVI